MEYRSDSVSKQNVIIILEENTGDDAHDLQELKLLLKRKQITPNRNVKINKLSQVKIKRHNQNGKKKTDIVRKKIFLDIKQT